jgi:YEATS domain-containing protein 4
MQATRSAVPSSSAGILVNDNPSVVGSGAAAAAAAVPSSTPTTASTRRLPNTTASLPIVYGSIAFYLGKKADELQTHEWTLFIRGPNQHDDHLSSVIISKVVFQLHPSFAQPIRELTEPPYEVTERGWGEFEAQIRIHWKDPTEQITILNHTLKLYPQGTPAPNNSNALLQQSTEKPVLAEMYDEVVFTDPTESFFRSLTQITAIPAESKDTDIKQEDDKTSPWKKHLNDVVYSDQEDFLALIGAQKFLQDELSKVKQRFQIVNDDITVVDQKLLLVQQQKQREAAAAAISGASHANAGGAASSSDGRKRTKKSRSTSQNKKARTTSSNKTTSAVPAVTISTKSTTSTTGTNKRKTTSTTTTTMSNKAIAAAAAAATTASNVPTTTTATVAATKPASTTTATATATATATTSSNSTTSTNNTGGNSNSTGVNIPAASSNTKK